MRKRSGTDGSLLASLPWTLGALTFALLPHAQYLPWWITAAFLACAGARWHIERKRWRLPPVWLRVVLSLVCFIGVFASYESVSGVGPGSALLAVMAALKLLETRQRRDQFVLLFISIFLIMATLLREQYIWSLPYLVLGLTLTMTAWLRMSAGKSVGVRQTFAASGRLVLYAAPLTLAMWIFFPRIAAPFWSVPIDTSRASSGLSDRMSPGDVSQLSSSDAVAFRVNFDGLVPPPSQRYWRGLVLRRFNGRTWAGGEPAFDARARDEIVVAGLPVGYQITMEPTQQQWVFALDIPYQWTLERTFMASQQELASEKPIDQRVTYHAASYLQYRLGPGVFDGPKAWYQALPGNSNPRTVELARRMRLAAGSDGAFIEDVLRMFHDEEYYYTLNPPALGNNPVDRFLFDTRKGFCEHFASAFAVMMRAAKLPSRIVLGYQGGEINPVGQYMIVRQSDAHAWTEVWLPEEGWLRIDPTAAVAPERIENGMSGARFAEAGVRWGLTTPSQLLHRLRLTWDALNAEWNEWILAYGPENQNLLMRWLGMQEPNWQKMMMTLLALIIFLVAAVSFLMLRRYRPPANDTAALLYRRFTKKAGVTPDRGESPDAYARRLASANIGPPPAIDDVTRCYLAARYGPPNVRTVAALRTAVSEFTARARA